MGSEVSSAMKTVQIIKKEEESQEKYHKNMKFYLGDLYQRALKDDNRFHFFYEPTLIIRLSNPSVIEQVELFFKNNGYETITYSYPMDENGESYFGMSGSAKNMRYGEQKGGIVMKNFELFINLFHTHSVAAITFSEKDHFLYLERMVHTAFNPRGITRDDEGEQLIRLGCMKCSNERFENIFPKERNKE